MKFKNRLQAAGLILALAFAGLVGASTPAAAYESAPAQVSAPVSSEISAEEALAAAGCDLFAFGPTLGAVGVFVEFDVFCDFFSPFFVLNGTLRAGGTTVAINSANCSGQSFCVLVVQSSGCLPGFLYSGRVDGAIQFPDGQIINFTRLQPIDGSGVRVC